MSLHQEHIARVIIRHRWVVLAFLVLTTVAGVLQLRKLSANNELDIWLDSSSDEYANYKNFTDHFGKDETIILLFHSDSLSTNRHLQLNYLLTDSLRTISGVKNVISMAGMQVPTGMLIGPASVPLLPKSVSNPGSIRDRLMRYTSFEGFLFSDDFKTTSFTVIPDSFSDRREIIARVYSLAERCLMGQGEYVVLGVTPFKESLNALSFRESKRFLLVSGLLILLISYAFFRRIREACLPLLIATVTICWVLGLMAVTGSRFNVVMSAMPLVLLVVVIANAIHFISGQISISAVYADTREAVVQNFSNKFYKCLYSSLTTAVAFLSFTLSNILPLKQFGLLCALGVMLSFALCFLFLTVIYSFTAVSFHKTGQDFSFIPKRAGLSGFVERNKRTVFAVCVMVFLVSVSGMTRLHVNTDQISYFRKNHPIRLATEKAERWLSGVMPFELLAQSDTSLFESPGFFLSTMRRYELALEEIPAIRSRQSLVTLLDDFGRAGGSGSLQSLLLQPSMVEKTGLSHFVSADGKLVRATVKTPWLGDKESLALMQQMEQLLEETFQGSGMRFYFTGASVVFARMGDRLVSSQVRSFSFTFLVIFGLFLLLYRDVRIALLCLIPNVLPVAATLGLMGLLNIPLDVSTVLVASVSFGIAVDDTIHFVGTYQDFRKTSDVRTSIDSAFLAVGNPLIMNTLLFAGGFFVMVFSDYRPMAFLGVFVSVNVILALISDLVVLPAILLLRK
jgi:uncharacterized protein